MIRAPDAPLGAGDPTRRHALRVGDLQVLPGLTRPEAESAAAWMPSVPEADRHLALAEVALPVLLSDGAGPYLLGSDGALVLVLGAHPCMPHAHLAMGAPLPLHAVGVVCSRPVGGWIWLARAQVPDHQRVAALDGLEAVADATGLGAWAAEWAGVIPANGL